MSDDLRRRLNRLRRQDPHARHPFIVTLTTIPKALDTVVPGMQIDQVIPDPPLLLGTMTAAQALAVAALPSVVRVEMDQGGVHTLD